MSITHERTLEWCRLDAERDQAIDDLREVLAQVDIERIDSTLGAIRVALIRAGDIAEDIAIIDRKMDDEAQLRRAMLVGTRR